MKANKVLLSSLVLAGAVSACTDDAIVESVQNNASMMKRTQVNLTLSTSEVDSRMTSGADGWTPNFETFDVLGAVLVDNGFISDEATKEAKDEAAKYYWNNVNWNLIDGHVGNNKWVFRDGKFVTDGTTSIGSWLFYTPYNEKMTTTRNGVEFNFPQIQEGAADLEWVMNNNANFYISPVAHIDGYEGQKLDFTIQTASVYNYLRMPFDLSKTGATKVQKIVVRAKTAGNVDAKFPLQLKVVNTNVPEAKLSLNAPGDKYVACPHTTGNTDLQDQIDEMQEAYDKLVFQGFDWKDDVSSAPITFENRVAARENSPMVDYLVVDLDDEHSDKTSKEGGMDVAKDGKFSAMMLMPAGVYYSLTFDIYTDKGVYQATVNNRQAYDEYLTDAEKAVINKNDSNNGENQIFLRPGQVTILSDIENNIKTVSNYAATLTDAEYIEVENKEVTEGLFITKTADLINFINGIKKSGDHLVNVIGQEAIGEGGENDDEIIPEHGVIINQDVMTALVEKEKAKGDIQLIFQGAALKIKGNDAANNRLDIHDMTFSNSAYVVSGYVKASSEVVIPVAQKMVVAGGADVELALSGQTTNYIFDNLIVNKAAKVTTTTNAAVNNITNRGSFNIESGSDMKGNEVVNQGTSVVTGSLSVATSFVNAANATLTNAGEMTLAGTAINNGTLTNNKNINVHGAFANNNVITIAAAAKVHVNSTDVASLTNNAGATITNNGMLYTKVGYNNTIVNMGTIDAKSGSSTYITKNSKEDETKVNTNSERQTMGVLKIAERKLKVSVTEENYQGYIEYTATADDLTDGAFAIDEQTNNKDKFNKVIFATAVKLDENTAGRVNYIVTNSDLDLYKGAEIQEVTFTAGADLYSINATIASLTINNDVLVEVPTDNVINIKNVIEDTSSTLAAIHNKGELLVGGDLYTTIAGKEYTTGGGEFSAGDGNASAFHWNWTWDESGEGHVNTENQNGYQVNNGVAVVVSQEGLNSVLEMNDVKEVKLAAGSFTINGDSEIEFVGSGSETIIEIETKSIKNAVISNAEINGDNGLVIKNGATAKFTNVVFTGNVGKNYTGNIKSDVKFEGCTFKAGFHIDDSGEDVNIQFVDCEFNKKAWIKLGGKANYSMDKCEIETIESDSTMPWGKQWVISYSDITFTECTIGRVIRAGNPINIALNNCVDTDGVAVTEAIVHANSNPIVTII